MSFATWSPHSAEAVCWRMRGVCCLREKIDRYRQVKTVTRTKTSAVRVTDTRTTTACQTNKLTMVLRKHYVLYVSRSHRYSFLLYWETERLWSHPPYSIRRFRHWINTAIQNFWMFQESSISFIDRLHKSIMPSLLDSFLLFETLVSISQICIKNWNKF